MSAHERSQLSNELSLPLRRAERSWGALALFGNTATAAMATWCFIIGGYIAFYLDAGQGSLVIFGGMLVGMFFVLLATLPPAAKYGLEATRSTRPQLGVRGSGFATALTIIFIVGWNTLLTIFLGRAAAEILISGGVLGESSRGGIEVGAGLLALGVVWFLLRRGPNSVQSIGPVVATIVLVLALAIIGLLISEFGWSEIVSAPAVAPYGDSQLDYVVGIELMLATAFSWWPYVAGLVRMKGDRRGSVPATVAGLGIAVSLVCLIGLYSGLAVPDSVGDPTTFLVDMGGLTFGIIALIFIILANIGTTTIGTLVSGLSIKQNPTADKRISWNVATGLSLVPVGLVLVVLSGPFYDNFGTFLAFSGVLFGPICGMQIADYYLVRHQTLDPSSLFRDDRSSDYWYVGGFNPVGFGALAVGFTIYLLLLDPITFESGSLFPFMTASIPATVMSGLTYFVGQRLLQARMATRPSRRAADAAVVQRATKPVAN